MHRNANIAITLIVTLGVVFIFALADFMRLILVDEFNDAVLMLDKTIDEAVFIKLLTPPLLLISRNRRGFTRIANTVGVPLMSAANRKTSWSKHRYQ